MNVVEIEKALVNELCANGRTTDEDTLAFTTFGALWMQKELIKKTLDWLRKNVNTYLYNTGGDEEYIPHCGDKIYGDLENFLLNG